MNNKDNQLKTTDLAWLAGIIEGDGYISMTVYRCNKERLKKSFKMYVRPVIGVTNQDMTLVNHVDNLFRRLNATGHIREHTTPKGAPIAVISTTKMSNVKKILDAIFPYLIGEKKARAELVLKFLDIRLGKMNSSLDEEELVILKEMGERFISRKGKKTGFSGFLREHTLSLSEDKMMCSELTGDCKND